MNTFTNPLGNTTYTDNGMATHKTSGSKVLDLFGKIGSVRNHDFSREFSQAFQENEDLAVRLLLWARDVRGGAGERSNSKILLEWLANNQPAIAKRLIPIVPEVGRWDDLFAMKAIYPDVFKFYWGALNSNNALAAKWLPSEKSKRWPGIFSQMAREVGVSPKELRKLKAKINQSANLVERDMCAKEWDKINYSHVPSNASFRYQKAFSRNDSERYAEYLQELEKPKEERSEGVKVNAGAVYPYDILASFGRGDIARSLAQWDELPNYIGEKSFLPIIDTSGSMGWSGNGKPYPIEVARSLGLYCATKNSGAWKNVWMTFSSVPRLVVGEGNVYEQYMNMRKFEIISDTNLEASIRLILDHAVRNKVTPSDMPEFLLIFSDMQFNSCVKSPSAKAKDMIREEFNKNGYEMPKVIFWNLISRNSKQSPVELLDQNTTLVSGFSPALMKAVLEVDGLEEFTPYSSMIKVLSNSRYDWQ